MKSKVIFMAIALALAGALLIGAADCQAAPKGRPMAAMNAKTVDLQLALRDLWVGHIFWVRNVVLATSYQDSAAAKVAEDQVVANAKAIAGSIIPFYGKDASEKLFMLLAGHWGAIKGYMTADFGNDTAGRDEALKKLQANADEIAAFLSSANPNWPKAALSSALQAHGLHHVKQINAVKAKDFEAEAKTWTMMKDHIYIIADTLKTGLVKQFPKKFK